MGRGVRPSAEGLAPGAQTKPIVLRSQLAVLHELEEPSFDIHNLVPVLKVVHGDARHSRHHAAYA
jgi:hypothetical protein